MSGALDAMVDLWLGPQAGHWGARKWGAPQRVLSGTEGRCWANARHAAAIDPDLRYVEGVVWRAGHLAAELHGWCLDCATGRAVEVTGPRYDDAVAYKGVVLDPHAVEGFLDLGDRRDRWGITGMLGVSHAEPPGVLVILLDEMGRGVRTPMATWATWRELRRPGPRPAYGR